MHKERLLKLADFLETVPRKKFSLGSWVQSMPQKAEGRTEGECGFAGCAIGWAVHAKLFKGLAFDKRYSTAADVNRPPTFEGYCGFEATDLLFGIERSQSFHLFVDSHYPDFRATPKQVAKRIRKFVESGHV